MHVSGDSPERERRQEFSYRILHGAGRKQKWHHGHGRGQQSGDDNSAESPSLEDLANFVHFPAREPAFERCFPPFARQPVRDKASDHRTRRRHQRVIKPQLLLARGEHKRCHIHGARYRKGGIVQQPEGNQTQAAEVKHPAPQASCQRRQRCRYQVTDNQVEFTSPMTLFIGSNRIPGHDWIPIVKLVDYKTIVARPNAALPNKRRQLITSPASLT